MKKLFVFSIFLVITGCADVSINIEELKYNEVLGANHSELAGRLFSISCNGNEYAEPDYVKSMCLSSAAELVYNKGYKYFSVIGQDGGATESVGSYTTNTPVTTYSTSSAYSGGYSAYGQGTSTTYVPQTHNYSVIRHHKFYTFVLIGDKEITKWNNYYKVSDYYIPKPKKDVSGSPGVA